MESAGIDVGESIGGRILGAIFLICAVCIGYIAITMYLSVSLAACAGALFSAAIVGILGVLCLKN